MINAKLMQIDKVISWLKMAKNIQKFPSDFKRFSAIAALTEFIQITSPLRLSCSVLVFTLKYIYRVATATFTVLAFEATKYICKVIF
ncbi:hypothetical protein [Nostoc commune]|uniref:hypothetical protein n=1 Tax=Nostoc commune TaxID=1178 RepID=UPI0018C8254A|nr:hypothetical protein [Nostoc commune]MBG1259641.1 hypothetical protein [Nostoc commune BAE]